MARRMRWFGIFMVIALLLSTFTLVFPEKGVAKDQFDRYTNDPPLSVANNTVHHLDAVPDSNTQSGDDALKSNPSPTSSSITITSPAPDYSWAAGTTHTIRWYYHDITDNYCKIDLYKGGVFNSTIVNFASFGWDLIGGDISGSYSWTLPQTQAGGSDYSIRVSTISAQPPCTGTSPDFTITGPPPPSITITSPTTGLSWAAGTTQTIRWYYANITDYGLEIDLYKGGVFHSSITSYAPIGSDGSGSYSWTLPQTQAGGTDYSIRISSSYSLTPCEVDSARFTITGPPPPSITITSPTAGNSWAAGTTQTIRWYYANITDYGFKIDLYKGGVFNSSITSYAPIGSGGSGSYIWTLPQTQAGGSNYSIRVSTSYSQPSRSGDSALFTITGPPPPSITITSPAAGNSWAAGTTQTIRWYYANITDYGFKIDLYKGGVFNSSITSYAPIGSGGSGSYSWTLPQTQAGGSNYSIRVSTSYSQPSRSGDSALFTITGPPPPSITITSPAAGNSWAAGTTQTIRWYYANITDYGFKIDLYKGGVFNSSITGYAPIGSGGSGSYSWTLPQTQAGSPDYAIVVSTTYSQPPRSGASALFTITGPPPPSITITSPAAGNSWAAGTTQTIRWYYANITDYGFKIDLYKGGVFNSSITSYAPIGSGGSGSYIWTLPQTQAGGSNYSIRVSTSYSQPSRSGDSALFTITGPPPPSITITSPAAGNSWAAGTTQTIRWYYANITDYGFKIDLYKGGVFNSSITGYTPIGSGGSGSYSWTLPQTQAGSPDYAIVVSTTYSQPPRSGASDWFTITGQSSSLPDLTIAAWPASSYTAGQTGVPVSVTVTRSGANLTSGTYVKARLYWSTNSVYDSWDMQLWESNGSTPDYPVSHLNTYGYKTVTPSITIPNVSPGAYYIIAIVDPPPSFHTESNENNNIDVKSVSVTAQAQSPVITSINPSTTTVGDFALTINGTGFDGGAVDQIYTPTGAYMGQGTISSRTSNQIVVFERMTGTAPGTYSVEVKNSDGRRSNRVQLTLSASTTLSDLTISASPNSSYTAGQTGVPVSVTVTRSGGNLTSGTYVKAQMYWSTNSVYDSWDTQLWESNGSTPDYPISYLNTYGSKTVTPSITIPNVSTGTYYIIAIVDPPPSYHTESNENNNTASYSVYISPPSPITWAFNQNGNFEGWTVTNMSSAAVSGGKFTFDPAGGDHYISSPTISAGASGYRNIEISMASNASDGSGAIFFKTQSENYYSEDKKVQFAVFNCSLCTNAPYNYYQVYMASHAKWSGVITGISIHPAENGSAGTNSDTIGIDYITIAP